jgi:lipid-binding SYLF domain-containing protein
MVAGLSLMGAAGWAAPVDVVVRQVTVSVDPKLVSEGVKTYGAKEINDLAAYLKQTVEKDLMAKGRFKASEADGAVLQLVLVDAKPNRPTFKQMSDRPGLSMQSYSVGGADIRGEQINADASRVKLGYSWFETDISQAATAEDLSTSSRQALQTLYDSNPAAAAISKKARAILVFPTIVKAGLVFGGSYGEGTLIRGGNIDGYYNSVSGTWGLQAGAQSFGYAVFLMSPEAVKYLGESKGWEIGVGPSVVVVNEGIAQNLSTSTLKDDAYAFIFNQQGLMVGVSIEGTKISKINPPK